MGYIGEIARYAHDSATNVSSVAVPVSLAAPAGTRIVLAVNSNPNTAMTGYTASDSKGNTWTQRAFQVHATSNNSNLGILECLVTTSLTTSDTITVGNMSNLRSPAIWLVLAHGFDDVSAGFDVQTSATGTSTAPASGATGAAAQASELVYGAVGFTGNPTCTLGSGFSGPAGGSLYATTTTRGLAAEWQYVTASGTRSAGSTLSGAQGWCAAVASFEQGAVPLQPFCFYFDGTNDIPMDVTVA
jgi:hypothetical protein